MTYLGYISGHLVQVWSKSAKPWLSNIKFNVISSEQFFQIMSIEDEFDLILLQFTLFFLQSG